MSVGQLKFGWSWLSLTGFSEFTCGSGCIYSIYSIVEQVATQSMLFSLQWQEHKNPRQIIQQYLKSLLVSHLLLFHWHMQVTWPSSRATGKEGKYIVYIKERYAYLSWQRAWIYISIIEMEIRMDTVIQSITNTSQLSIKCCRFYKYIW